MTTTMGPSDGQGFIALAAVAACSIAVTATTALVYNRHQLASVEQEKEDKIRNERRKLRRRYRQTAEYQRKKQLKEEWKR